jgi:hypothetical protein
LAIFQLLADTGKRSETIFAPLFLYSPLSIDTPVARHEQDREDLLREATALVRRIELLVAGEPETVVIGFRAGGAASIYFGAAPVYQFNTQLELRRAFDEIGPLKVVGRQLIRFQRVRTATRTELVSTPLSPAEQVSFLTLARNRLEILHASLAQGKLSIVGQVPPDSNLLATVIAWLSKLPPVLSCAEQSGVH